MFWFITGVIIGSSGNGGRQVAPPPDPPPVVRPDPKRERATKLKERARQLSRE